MDIKRQKIDLFNKEHTTNYTTVNECACHIELLKYGYKVNSEFVHTYINLRMALSAIDVEISYTLYHNKELSGLLKQARFEELINLRDKINSDFCKTENFDLQNVINVLGYDFM